MKLLVICQAPLADFALLFFLPFLPDLLPPPSTLESYPKTLTCHTMASYQPLHQAVPSPGNTLPLPSSPGSSYSSSRSQLRHHFLQKSFWVPLSWIGSSSYVNTMSLTSSQLLSLGLKMACLLFCFSQETLSSMREGQSLPHCCMPMLFAQPRIHSNICSVSKRIYTESCICFLSEKH